MGSLLALWTLLPVFRYSRALSVFCTRWVLRPCTSPRSLTTKVLLLLDRKDVVQELVDDGDGIVLMRDKKAINTAYANGPEPVAWSLILRPILMDLRCNELS